METNGKIPGPNELVSQAGEVFAGEQGSKGECPRVLLSRHRSDAEVVLIGVFVVARVDRQGDERPKHRAKGGEYGGKDDCPHQHGYAACGWLDGKNCESVSSVPRAAAASMILGQYFAGMLPRLRHWRTVTPSSPMSEAIASALSFQTA